jgi:hypothetical protein
LEDTPNSVLRRVFGLCEEGTGPECLEPRVARLVALVQDLVGQRPQVEAARKGYAFLSHTGMVVADLRPQKERLRVEASKTVAETAGLTSWASCLENDKASRTRRDTRCRSVLLNRSMCFVWRASLLIAQLPRNAIRSSSKRSISSG